MTVLLLHAFPLDERMWEPQLDALTGHDVSAPRLYGRGRTMAAWAESVADETEGELLVVGEFDPFVSAQELAAFDVREIAETGHLVNLERPEVFNFVLREFLDHV